MHERTVKIRVGRKLRGKSRQEIVEEILENFGGHDIEAVQQNYDIVKITFAREEDAVAVLAHNYTSLFGHYCKLDSGPPVTIVHLFDYPHEERHEAVKNRSFLIISGP